MVCLLHVRPEWAANLRQPDELVVEPDLERDEFLDDFGNRATRVVTRPGQNRFFQRVHRGGRRPAGRHRRRCPAAARPRASPETLQFLLASRYCEVDALSDLAWQLFGNTPLGWARVQAACDWVQHTR